MAEKTLWGIHAGKGGVADSLFLSKNVIAIGWAGIGDLSNLKTREKIKEKYSQIHPNSKAGAIATGAGQIYRFRSEMQIGDLVVYPSPISREVYIGEIIGDYEYRPQVSERYPNHRNVKWLKHIPRKNFSQGALYEIGSALTLFQIKNYADEFLSALEGKPIKVEEIEDASTSLISTDIEDQTRDFVLKQLSKNLKGLPLEEFVAHLLEKMGYKARLTRSNEASVDIIAHKDELGFVPPIIKVQVKSSDSKITDKDVSALYGKVGSGEGEYGLLVTLGDFTPPAINFANSKSKLRLINGTVLVDLIFKHYEQFDSKYKSIIPLKNIYIPESVEQEEE